MSLTIHGHSLDIIVSLILGEEEVEVCIGVFLAPDFIDFIDIIPVNSELMKMNDS